MKLLTTCLAVIAVLGIARTARADAGEDAFSAKCAVCHGKDAKGKTKMGEKLGAKDLTDAKLQDSLTDDQIQKTILEGIPAKKMPAQKDKMSADDIKAVVKYVRTLKGK